MVAAPKNVFNDGIISHVSYMIYIRHLHVFRLLLQVLDGYFVHFVAPSDLPPMRKHAVFALDTSGSMRGRKWAQTKEALAAVLGDLLQRGEGFDSFSLLDFADGVRVWRAAEEATEESVREALEQVEALEPEGEKTYLPTLPSRTNDRIQKSFEF